MKIANFKEHEIKRTCQQRFDDPRKYKDYLRVDFHGRCCYCNMSEDLITTSFHVEHFIPRKVFKGKKDSLDVDYNNLMWSCPKCNLSKGDKYEGDFENNSKIENDLFYNPVDIDYNDIFYRNEMGSIMSDDPKGKEMIKLLKLYRPIHNLGWTCEKMENVLELMEAKIGAERDLDRKEALRSLRGEIALICVEKMKLFRIMYK